MMGIIFATCLGGAPCVESPVADCVYDRSLEYANNGEPASIFGGVRAFMQMVQICIGDRDWTEEDVHEIRRGLERALTYQESVRG